jgi:hypothetical protein
LGRRKKDYPVVAVHRSEPVKPSSETRDSIAEGAVFNLQLYAGQEASVLIGAPSQFCARVYSRILIARFIRAIHQPVGGIAAIGAGDVLQPVRGQ